MDKIKKAIKWILLKTPATIIMTFVWIILLTLVSMAVTSKPKKCEYQPMIENATLYLYTKGESEPYESGELRLETYREEVIEKSFLQKLNDLLN